MKWQPQQSDHNNPKDITTGALATDVNHGHCDCFHGKKKKCQWVVTLGQSFRQFQQSNHNQSTKEQS